MKIVSEYRFFHRFQEFVQLVTLNFDSKHRSDPFKNTPRIKYSGKDYSLNSPLEIRVSHDLRKKYSIFTLTFVFMSLIYILFQMVCLLSKVLLKLLDQTKETILITALEKIHIIGENSKWMFWEAKDRFCIFGKNSPNWLSKIKQRVCNLVFHIQILKNHENKAKRPLLKFVSMSLTCPISNGMFLLLKCSKSVP